MRLFLAVILVVVFALNVRSFGQEADAESLPTLRMALVQTYEAMDTINAKFKAAKEEFEAAELQKRAEAVEMLTKVAKKEITFGNLEEAKNAYTKVIELAPYNKDAEQFFMSTGAGELRTKLILERLTKNAFENLRSFDVKRAKTWMAAAMDLAPDNQDVASLRASINALDSLKQLTAMPSHRIETKNKIAKNGLLTTRSRE